MKKLFILFIAVAGFGVSSFGQGASITTSVTGTARIVAALTVTKTGNLDFGAISPGLAGGTAILSNAAVPTATGTGDVTCSGAVTNAKFDVNGESTANYKIIMPATVILTNGTPAKDMTATLSCSTALTGNLISAKPTFYIGASLAVAAAATQTSGTYSNSGFNVTVAYE